MPAVNFNEIDLGSPVFTGHEVYPGAKYLSKKVIFKKNKHQNPLYSRLEMAFSELANLFLPPHSTPSQDLVVNAEGAVEGLMVEHIGYVIEKKEGLSQPFYSLTAMLSEYCFEEQKVDSPKVIPYYFLDQLPHGYFDELIRRERAGQLTIDYSSLAKVLATSYTLEEDDLHKGNLGIYIVQDEEKPKIVFFKIDHDLMFIDSIMSFYSQRPAHWVNNETAFEITAEDLLDFPDIKSSSNGYWPTRISRLSNPWGDKEYHDKDEVNAFAKLKEEPAFQRAKWLSFYKHILMPEALIKEALERCLDKNNPVDRAQIAMITSATLARQARLKSVLFTVQAFREFVLEISEEEVASLIQEVSGNSKDLADDVKGSMTAYKDFCNDHYVEGDTALHVAIKLGDYRYEENTSFNEHLIHQKNANGETPLDVAVAMQETKSHLVSDIRQDYRLIMRHLLGKGAEKTPLFKQWNTMPHVEQYRFKTPFMGRAKKAATYEELQALLRGDCHFRCVNSLNRVS